jgi:hypothetical protein
MVAHTRKKCAHQLHRRPCVTISRGWSKGLQHYPLMVSNANSSNRSSIRGGAHAKEVCPPTAPQTLRLDKQRRVQRLAAPSTDGQQRQLIQSIIHPWWNTRERSMPTHCTADLALRSAEEVQRLAAPSTDGQQRQIIQSIIHPWWSTRERSVPTHCTADLAS